MVMCANDTTLYCILGDLSDDIINTQLTKVGEWLAANKLSLNVKKTKYMVFYTPKRKVTYPGKNLIYLLQKYQNLVFSELFLF